MRTCRKWSTTAPWSSTSAAYQQFCVSSVAESRTATAALALSMAVILVMRYPVRVLVAGIAVAAAMLLYVLLDLDTIAIAEQISRTGRAQEVFTLTGRTRIWSFYFEQIGEAPFFGYGYASTKYLMPLV
ncbi:MAG: O-antigen ligase family protein [Burkholderiaceae bacterium]